MAVSEAQRREVEQMRERLKDKLEGVSPNVAWAAISGLRLRYLLEMVNNDYDKAVALLKQDHMTVLGSLAAARRDGETGLPIIGTGRA